MELKRARERVKINMGTRKTVRAIKAKVEKLDVKLQRLQKRAHYSIVGAFVTFNAEESKNKCLALLSPDWLNMMWRPHKYRFNGARVYANQAEPPTNINYRNLQASSAAPLCSRADACPRNVPCDVPCNVLRVSAGPRESARVPLDSPAVRRGAPVLPPRLLVRDVGDRAGGVLPYHLRDPVPRPRAVLDPRVGQGPLVVLRRGPAQRYRRGHVVSVQRAPLRRHPDVRGRLQRRHVHRPRRHVQRQLPVHLLQVSAAWGWWSGPGGKPGHVQGGCSCGGLRPRRHGGDPLCPVATSGTQRRAHVPQSDPAPRAAPLRSVSFSYGAPLTVQLTTEAATDDTFTKNGDNYVVVQALIDSYSQASDTSLSPDQQGTYAYQVRRRGEDCCVSRTMAVAFQLPPLRRSRPCPSNTPVRLAHAPVPFTSP